MQSVRYPPQITFLIFKIYHRHHCHYYDDYYFHFFCFFLWGKLSLWGPGWFGTFYAAQVSLELFPSWFSLPSPGIIVWTTMPGLDLAQKLRLASVLPGHLWSPLRLQQCYKRLGAVPGEGMTSDISGFPPPPLHYYYIILSCMGLRFKGLSSWVRKWSKWNLGAV